jgi:hypothetical protein
MDHCGRSSNAQTPKFDVASVKAMPPLVATWRLMNAFEDSGSEMVSIVSGS